MFVCIHSRRLGPAGGGTRMKVYASPAEALRDATRLAAGMTAKFAVAGLPFGGGKAVIAVPRLPTGEGRRELLHRYGRLICSLGGNFLTGCDMNTTPADLDVIEEVCPHVFGNSGGSGEPGPFTARGVFHGIRASVAHADGSPVLERKTVLVQGVGSVGARLAALLAEAGADVARDRRRRERAPQRSPLRSARAPSTPSMPSKPAATSTRRARPAGRSRPQRFRSCAAASSPAPRTTSSPSPPTLSGSASGGSSTRRTS